MSRVNRCIIDDNGDELWISRSAVVIPVVFYIDRKNGDVYTLVEKRGESVSHTGEWCCPCGFIDWDESLEEACIREVREETGIELDINNIDLFDVKLDKFSASQNIDLWYTCVTFNDSIDFSKIETKDEVSDVKWLKVAHLTRGWFPVCKIFVKDIYDCYGKWAFKTHKTFIIEMLKEMFDTYIIKMK